MNAQTLLVVNGDGAAGALQAAGLAGDNQGSARPVTDRRLLVLRDVLSCGSLQGAALSRDLTSWSELREAFWRRVWAHGQQWGWVDEPFGAVGRLPDNLYLEAEALQRADTVIACVGAGLSDQLLLAFLVAWSEHLELDASRLQVAAYLDRGDDDPGAPPAGVPHLDPGTLRAGWFPRPLDTEERRALRTFWTDYTRGDDVARATWIGPRGADPWDELAPGLALARSAWASREPAAPGHLAAWDRALLEASAPGPGPLGELLGQAMRSPMVQGDPVGDLVLLHRIVTRSDPAARDAWWRLGEPRGMATSCAVTPYGAELLESGSRAAADSRTRDWLWGLGEPH